jgi:hypothetical protein
VVVIRSSIWEHHRGEEGSYTRNSHMCKNVEAMFSEKKYEAKPYESELTKT